MEKKTAAQLFAPIRDSASAAIVSALEGAGYECLPVKLSTWACPFVDEDGNEGFFKVAVSYCKGSRDGDAYDGFTESQSYLKAREDAARKKEEAARKTAERKAEQERKRAEKAAAKAAKEKQNDEEEGE